MASLDNSFSRIKMLNNNNCNYQNSWARTSKKKEIIWMQIHYVWKRVRFRRNPWWRQICNWTRLNVYNWTLAQLWWTQQDPDLTPNWLKCNIYLKCCNCVDTQSRTYDLQVAKSRLHYLCYLHLLVGCGIN